MNHLERVAVGVLDDGNSHPRTELHRPVLDPATLPRRSLQHGLHVVDVHRQIPQTGSGVKRLGPLEDLGSRLGTITLTTAPRGLKAVEDTGPSPNLIERFEIEHFFKTRPMGAGADKTNLELADGHLYSLLTQPLPAPG